MGIGAEGKRGEGMWGERLNAKVREGREVQCFDLGIDVLLLGKGDKFGQNRCASRQRCGCGVV